MQAFYGTRISDHISETPEGFLVAHGAALARTAVARPQQYRGSELGLQHDELVNVYRSPQEVLSKKFLASLNGKPVTDAHPDEFLNVENNRWYAKGHVQNAKVGPRLPNGERAVVGDLVITDAALIAKIRSGTRDLSVGYECVYHPRGDGSYEQRGLRANHVAVVDRGRAGEHVRIMDREREKGLAMSKKQTDEENDSIMARIVAALEKLEARHREEVEPDEEEEEQLVESADTSPALLKLRRLRPVIEASGDRRAIDAYNTAVRTLRKQAKERSSLVAADNFNYRPQRGNEADYEAASRFEDSVRRARRLARNEPEAVEELQTAHAEDATARDEDEAWGRRMMREGKRRRGEKEAMPETRPRVARQIEDSGESFEDVCARRREQLRNS